MMGDTADVGCKHNQPVLELLPYSWASSAPANTLAATTERKGQREATRSSSSHVEVGPQCLAEELAARAHAGLVDELVEHLDGL